MLAAKAGIKILAVTDHDIIASETIEIDGKTVGLTDYAGAMNITVLRGIEFSCDIVVEDVHIVALGCDFGHPFFEQEYQNSIQSKIDGYRELCGLLTEDGIKIDWHGDILLHGERDENAVQRKHIFEAIAQKGYVYEWSDAKLLVKNTKKFAVKRKKPDPEKIIESIHKTGGIAILAHPYLIDETALWKGIPVSRERYIDHLIEAGLDGIEVSYPYDKTSYGGTVPIDRIEDDLRRLYSGRIPVLSGGSDYHNEGKKGSKNPRELGEKGVTMDYFMNTPLLRGLLDDKT